MALGTHTQFKLVILIRSMISVIHKFRENILKRSRSISETTPSYANFFPFDDVIMFCFVEWNPWHDMHGLAQNAVLQFNHYAMYYQFQRIHFTKAVSITAFSAHSKHYNHDSMPIVKQDTWFFYVNVFGCQGFCCISKDNWVIATCLLAIVNCSTRPLIVNEVLFTNNSALILILCSHHMFYNISSLVLICHWPIIDLSL